MAPNGLPGPAPSDGARADAPPLSHWQKFGLVVKVVELRLRFVALMAITGLTFAYWDTLWNHYDKWMRPAGHSHAAVAGIEYYCPMHPQVAQEEPGSCPICGMPLAKRKKGEKPALPEGLTARVELAPFRIRQAGITTADVGYAPLAQTLTTVGNIALDERRLATIVSKVAGKSRVEKLHVNVTGQPVRAGEPLAELYSPELYQAIQELLTASQRAEQTAAAVQTPVGRSLLGDRRELVRLSAEKLKRWGITQAQVDDILRTRPTDYNVTILAPMGGTVVKKNIREGQEVEERFPMFEIADLSHVWVQAQVYEHQVALVREGQAVEATVEAYPGEVFPGTVAFVQPTLDADTRTVEVRFDLANPGLRLRPGMFATVTLKASLADTTAFRSRLATARRSSPGSTASLTVEQQRVCPVTQAKLGSMGDPVAVEVEQRKVWTCCGACPPKIKAQPAKYLARLEPAPRDEVLTVPESAVIDAGTKKLVYVEAEPGVFEGREVVLGPRVGDRYPVLEGLAPGERVAAAGAFLIDAESRINPGTAPAGPHSHGTDQPEGRVEPGAAPAGSGNDRAHQPGRDPVRSATAPRAAHRH